MPRPARFASDPRQRKSPNRAPPPLPGEPYPATCHGCGRRVTQAGGCVERYTKADGARRWHFFGCGPVSAIVGLDCTR